MDQTPNNPEQEQESPNEVTPTPRNPVTELSDAEQTDLIPIPLNSRHFTAKEIELLLKEIRDNETMSDELKDRFFSGISETMGHAPTDGTDTHKTKALTKGYAQDIPHQGAMVRIQSRAPSGVDKERITSVKDTLDFLAAHGSTGRDTKIPLTNSRMTVTVGDITEEDMYRLVTSVLSITANSYRPNGGLTLSTDDYETNVRILDMIIPKIKSSTLNGANAYHYRKAIKITDLQALYAGVLDSLYPNGYPVFNNCMNIDEDGNQCSFGVDETERVSSLDKDGRYGYKGNIRFSDMIVVDSKGLTDKDLEFITAPSGTIELKELLDYQKQCESKSFLGPLNDTGNVQYSIRYTVPSIEEYFSASKKWSNYIQSLANKLISDNDYSIKGGKSEEEIKYIRDKKDSDLAMAFSTIASRHQIAKARHWILEVKAVTANGSTIIEGESAIDELIEREFNKNEAIRKGVGRTYREFRSKANLTICCHWNWECPECHNRQIEDTDELEHPDIVPVNMVNFFVFVAGRVFINLSKTQNDFEEM